MDKKNEAKKSLISWLISFVEALAIALFLTTFVFTNSIVPSGSMETTIMTNDRVLGNRIAYYTGSPQRGDIVVFYAPDYNDSVLYCKRVIGEPGDNVRIADGKVFINGEYLDESEYLGDLQWGGEEMEFDVPEGHYFMMGDNRDHSNDSRYWNNHFVEEDKILAKLGFVYYPFNHIGFVN